MVTILVCRAWATAIVLCAVYLLVYLSASHEN
jgi:hypothetical protein